ncbi:MAG: NAD(+)/NADH kinase, partial [Paludibacter sp.]|nr:NAD(+)/NADH kinase [Paludibacter sp.]
MKIAVFGNIYRPVIISHIKVLLDFFNQKPVKLLLDNELFDFVKAYNNCCLENIEIIDDDNFEADVALSIGGDGTFLTTAARVGRKSIPILGINTGRLGFLADVSGENILQALETIISKK